MEKRCLLQATFHVRPHVGTACRAGPSVSGAKLPIGGGCSSAGSLKPVGTRNKDKTASQRCDVLKREPGAKHGSGDIRVHVVSVRVERNANQRTLEVH